MTTAPLNAPAQPRRWRGTRLRETLTRGGRQGKAAVSAARHHNWSPALTVSALGCGVASAWTTFGLGAGLLALMGALLALDWSRD